MTRRLLFVVNVDWFFLSHRMPVAQQAQREGYEVHLATGLTDRRAELEAAGLVVHPLAITRGHAGWLASWAVWWALLRLFLHLRPDLVHLVSIKPVLLGGLAARLAGVPAVVAAISGLGFVFTAQGWRADIRRWAVGGLYRLALGGKRLRVICQNRDDLDQVTHMAGLDAGQTMLIRGSGVDLTRFVATPLPDGMPVVMLAARLLADKGVREFVMAARQLRGAGVQARFCLVGAIDPDNPASLGEAELQAWAQEGVVELWGHRADMPQVLAASHVVVLPSYREGMPKILLEAAACGRAVVTTDVPGCRDAIEPNISGLLVPPRDGAALALVIRRLLDDPLACRRMGQAGWDLAQRCFGEQDVVAAHMRLYAELMERV